MDGTVRRVADLEELFARCRRDWRTVFDELEFGEGTLVQDDPWCDLDLLLGAVSAEERDEFRAVLRDLLAGERPEEQAQALSILAACQESFDFSIALALEPQLREDLEAHLALILAIGQRRVAEGRPVLQRALEDPHRRHAALIALAQLDPEGCGSLGRECYARDRDQIRATLDRPLAEHEYATFYQMAEGLAAHGKDPLNRFLRAVAGDDAALEHELALLARRVLRQRGLET